jgi:hypothetical protein
VAVINEMIGDYKSWTEVVITHSTCRVISVNWSCWLTTEVKVLNAEPEPWSTPMRSIDGGNYFNLTTVTPVRSPRRRSLLTDWSRLLGLRRTQAVVNPPPQASTNLFMRLLMIDGRTAANVRLPGFQRRL